MIDTLMQVTSALFLLIGSFLCVSGGIGILRFPDFYTRMHAVGVTETLATTMIIFGLILHNPDLFIDVKLVIILLMTLFISPTASHTLANAAMRSDISSENSKKNETEQVKSSNS